MTTESPSVTLNISAENAVEMAVCASGVTNDVPWETYATSSAFTFTDTSAGEKQVVVVFRSSNSNVALASDSIVLVDAAQTGALEVNDDGGNAKIILNGRITDYTTPYILTGLAPGNYLVSLAKSGASYLPAYSNVTVVAGQTVQVSFINDADPALGPSIRANGRRNSVTIDHSQTVSITAAMNVGTYPTDVPVDWWVVASANLSAWYYMDSTLAWMQAAFTGNNYTVFHPVYQGPLLDLSSTTVLPAMNLPPGMYYFWFAVDYPADGILDPNGAILYDQVIVTVQ